MLKTILVYVDASVRQESRLRLPQLLALRGARPVLVPGAWRATANGCCAAPPASCWRTRRCRS